MGTRVRTLDIQGCAQGVKKRVQALLLLAAHATSLTLWIFIIIVLIRLAPAVAPLGPVVGRVKLFKNHLFNIIAFNSFKKR